MATLDLKRKLAILADAAKYDASCASSGGTSAIPGPAGHRLHRGHGHLPRLRAGRALHLAAKILLTNFCIYDCAYCINRASSQHAARAGSRVEEVVDLTLDFYRRNYIEGLFLSSGIIRSPDYTMEQMVRVARSSARGARLPRLHPPEDRSPRPRPS